MQKSYMAREKSIQKQWYLVDAEQHVLGKMAVEIATILMGKHHPWYTPHADTGDFVIVVNAEKIKTTGKKRENRQYYRWSGYPGGLKVTSMEKLQQKHPEKIIYLAVRRMLPKTRLGRRMLKKLKVYKGPDHRHQAQCPKEWKREAVRLKEVLIND